MDEFESFRNEAHDQCRIVRTPGSKWNPSSQCRFDDFKEFSSEAASKIEGAAAHIVSAKCLSASKNACEIGKEEFT